MTPRALFTLLGMLALGGLSGCSNNPTRAALGTMNIQMTDAPGDFDVSRSIVLTGNGQYVLNPVTRIVTLSLPDQKPGAIHGTVAPGDVATSVFVMQDADTVTSSLTAADGGFTVSLLPAGAYRLVFHPWRDYQ